MPTTIDRFLSVIQICQNLATMQNNMRANVVTIQTSNETPLPGTPTTIAFAYSPGSGSLGVTNAALLGSGPVTVVLGNAAQTVLREVSRANNTLTVTVKFSDQAASVGMTVNAVSALYHDFPATQQAVRDLGTAFLQRLAMNQNILTAYPAQLAAGATAAGVIPADVTAMQSLLTTWATNLNTAVITNQTQLDNGVAAVLANVPPAEMLVF